MVSPGTIDTRRDNPEWYRGRVQNADGIPLGRQGNVDEIILLELPRAGSLPRMRLTGMLVGMKEVLPSLESCPVTYIDGDGQFVPSLEMVRKHLRSRRLACRW